LIIYIPATAYDRRTDCTTSVESATDRVKTVPIDSTVQAQAEYVFLTARRHASAVYALVVFVCLSQVGVLLKQLNVGSRKQRLTIAQGL